MDELDPRGEMWAIWFLCQMKPNVVNQVSKFQYTGVTFFIWCCWNLIWLEFHLTHSWALGHIKRSSSTASVCNFSLNGKTDVWLRSNDLSQIEQVSQLAALVQAQVGYHSRSAEILTQLTSKIDERLVLTLPVLSVRRRHLFRTTFRTTCTNLKDPVFDSVG